MCKTYHIIIIINIMEVSGVENSTQLHVYNYKQKCIYRELVYSIVIHIYFKIPTHVVLMTCITSRATKKNATTAEFIVVQTFDWLNAYYI